MCSLFSHFNRVQYCNFLGKCFNKNVNIWHLSVNNVWEDAMKYIAGSIFCPVPTCFQFLKYPPPDTSAVLLSNHILLFCRCQCGSYYANRCKCDTGFKVQGLSLDFESTSMFCGNCAWKYEQVNLIQTTVTAPNNYIFKTPKHLTVANKITYFLLYHKVGIYAVCNKTTLIFDIWVTKSNHRFRFKLKEPNFFHHQFNSFLIFC